VGFSPRRISERFLRGIWKFDATIIVLGPAVFLALVSRRKEWFERKQRSSPDGPSLSSTSISSAAVAILYREMEAPFVGSVFHDPFSIAQSVVHDVVVGRTR